MHASRGKYKTFDDRMEDLKRFKETHGHANVTTREDIPVSKFCTTTRNARNIPGKGTKLTDKRIAAFDALGFNWMTKEYITKSFDERIEDLKEFENNSLYQFCADVRHSLKQVERVWHKEADGRAHNKA